ncbi:DNA cytosine methyltransferase [Lentzea albidocapillata]|uniref:DNA cytosine methyltransferase n=1 Tax=Lentzea albidocapillata TaxID=40571 RepID=UPI00210C483E|nr:DNA cytosine methyltransferase [Lentzea albidocapillata]
MAVVGQVEINPFCQQVLAKHWPEVPRHDDVRTAVQWWRSQRRPAVDVVAGGFPCQPVSDSGLKLAQQDERWLWPAMFDVIAALRPTWVVAENVPGLHRRGLADVLRDLRRAGYRARAGLVSACAVGAPHARERMFVLAHAESEGRCPWRHDRGSDLPQHGHQPHSGGPGGRGGWPAEPDVDRVAHGVPDGVDRRRALGNAVVPAVAEHIGRLITAGAIAERNAA